MNKNNFFFFTIPQAGEQHSKDFNGDMVAHWFWGVLARRWKQSGPGQDSPKPLFSRFLFFFGHLLVRKKNRKKNRNI